MDDVALMLLLVVFATTELFAFAYLFARLARPPRPLPVFTSTDPYERFWLLVFGLSYLLFPALVFATKSPSPSSIASLLVLTLGWFWLWHRITSRDRRRFEHLQRQGRRIRLRVVKRSTPTHGGPQPEFVLTAMSDETGQRDFRVGPSAYHQLREGDEFELLVDPRDSDCWQILRPGATV